MIVSRFYEDLSVLYHKNTCFKKGVSFWFARHGRALTGVSPEHAQIVGSV